MMKSLLFGTVCGLLMAGPCVAAVAPEDDGRKSAAAALEQAEKQLEAARRAAEEARASAKKLQDSELAKVREALKSAEVELPDDALRAVEKALATAGEGGKGLSVITVDASGLATWKDENGEQKQPSKLFRKRVVIGSDGNVLEVTEEGDQKDVLGLIERAKAKGGTAEIKKEVHLETKAYSVGPDGELKELKGGLKGLPGVLDLRSEDVDIRATGELNKGIRVLLRDLDGKGTNVFSERFTPRGRDAGNAELLKELKKLNERLSALEARLDKIESD